MKNLLMGTVAAFSLGVFASTSNAADLMDYPVASAYDWGGMYIGGQLGYVFGSADHTFSNGAPADDSSPDGLVGGIHAGYNAQSGNIVFGLEADFEGAAVDGDYTNNTAATSVGTTDMDWQGSVRARVGYAADSYLFFATGGWAFGSFDFGGGPSPLPVAGGYSETLHGWTAGAGVETMLTQNWRARLEYRYTDFGSASGTLAPGFPAVTMPVGVETHAIRIGVSYKF